MKIRGRHGRRSRSSNFEVGLCRHALLPAGKGTIMRPLGAATFSAPVEPPRMTTTLLLQRRCGRKIGLKQEGRDGRLGDRRQRCLHNGTAASLGRAAAAAAAPHPNTGQGRNRFGNDRNRRRRRRRRDIGSGKGVKPVKVVPQLLDVARAFGRVGRSQRQDGGEQVHGRGRKDGGGGTICRSREASSVQILNGCGGGFHSLGQLVHWLLHLCSLVGRLGLLCRGG